MSFGYKVFAYDFCQQLALIDFLFTESISWPSYWRHSEMTYISNNNVCVDFFRLKTNVFFTIVILIVIWKSNFKCYYNLKRSWFGVSFTLRNISLMVVMRSSSNIFTLEKKNWRDVCVRKIIKHRWQVTGVRFY